LLAALSADLGIRLADATEDLERAEQEGVAQYWAFDTHPRAAGYTTIARRILHALKGDAR
jgi:lysophospholipase L1-like esterase